MIEDFTVMPERTQAPLPDAPFHHWSDPQGGVWLTFHRHDDGYLLRFPGFADFLIPTDGGPALCWPVPNLPQGTREHLFLNQVLPLVLSHRGQSVFHGSCIEWGEGAIAFLGPSGRGKSTLAASFATAGARFLTDDGLVLEPGPQGFMAQPSHPSVRVWSDTRDALLAPGMTTAAQVNYSSKERFLAATALPHCPEPRRLLAAFFLGEGEASDIAFRHLGGGAAVAAWMAHSFIIDVADRRLIDAQFAGVAALASSVPSIALDYPRRYDQLDALRAAIVAEALRAAGADR